MKNSSAALKDDETTTFAVEAAEEAVATGPSAFEATVKAQQNLPPNIYAATAREAGRLNAAKIRPDELDALLQERQRLLDRKFAGTLTKSESNRLTYVRWSLDRIDDARRGAALEAMDAFVSRLEGFKTSVDQLNRDLHASKRSK